jgi:hypothetical protein
LLESRSAGRKATRSASQALLLGKLYDDRGNRMSPSYSTKNGIRYRFYVSSALLRGRKAAAGSVARVAAAEIEDAVLAALKTHQQAADACDAICVLERVIVARSRLLITMGSGDLPRQEIVIPWTAQQKDARPTIDDNSCPKHAHNENLIQSVVRAHAWMHLLQDGAYGSIEELADADKRTVCSFLLRLNALAGIFASVGPASDLDFGSAGRLVSDCYPSFDLHIGELAIVFPRAALAVSMDREFQKTIRQHSSLDF